MQGLISIAPVWSIKTLALVALTLTAAVLGGWWLVPQHGVDGLLWLLIGVGGLAGGVVIFVWPIWGVLLLAFMIPLEGQLDLGELTWIRAVGLVIFAAWMLRKLVSRTSWAKVLSANILKPALLFVILATASLLWSEHFPSAFEDLWSTAQLLALSLLVVDVVDSWRRLEWVVRALILSGVVVLTLTLYQSVFQPEVIRAGGSVSGGVNQTATYIVLLTPFAFYLLRGSTVRMWRVLGLAYIALAPLAVSRTLSRTSFVIMPIVLGSQFWDMFKGGHRNRLYLLLSGLVAGVILLVAVDWEGVAARTNTISSVIQGVPTAGGESQSSRMHHWLGAVAIFNDHPLVGAGYGNYGFQFLSYQYSVSPKWVEDYYTAFRSPHSSFLGILAELGLIGTALWIWLLAVATLNVRKGWSASRKMNNRLLEVLAQAMLYSLLAYVLYSFFEEVHVHKLLWLLFGLTEVLRRLVLSDQERTGAALSALVRST
jgi:O-antigen ligase